jgi:hypothetical protein
VAILIFSKPGTIQPDRPQFKHGQNLIDAIFLHHFIHRISSILQGLVNGFIAKDRRLKFRIDQVTCFDPFCVRRYL